MSVEREYSSKLERKVKQFNRVKRLIFDELPKELGRVSKRGEFSSIVLDKGSDHAIEFSVSDFKKGWDDSIYMLSVKEIDIRRYSGAYMPDLANYFPKEELLILDITYENIEDEFKFFTLESEDMRSGGIVMLRDTQFEYEEDMYDEYYYFLVNVK